MTLVRLVRHGRASAGWDAHVDPDLDEHGWSQARAVARQLGPLGALPVITSPLQRCRSTAEPLCTMWGVAADVDDAVAEIPSPIGVAQADRVDWLRAAMTATWTDLGERYCAYRDAVVARVARCERDTVIFSHFVAINGIIGACLGDDHVLIRSLDNASVTVVEVAGGTGADDGPAAAMTGRRLRLVAAGAEADTLIR